MKTKPAHQIQPGDLVIEAATGQARKVTRVSRPGLFRGSVIIEWAGDWACVHLDNEIELTDNENQPNRDN